MRVEFWVFLAAVTVLKCAVTVIDHIRHASRARKLGCKPPAKFLNRWPFGLDAIVRMVKSDWKKELPHLFIECFESEKTPEGRPVYTLQLNQLSDVSYFTCDPKNIQAVLASQFHDFEFGEKRRNGFHPLLGTGIFASDGKAWEHSRSLLRPQFVREQVSHLELEERHVQNAMKALTPGRDGWTSVTDIQSIFFRLTLDTSTEFLFGESVDSQLSALDDRQSQGLPHVEFGTEFDKAQWYLSFRVRLQSFYWMIDSLAFRRAIQTVHKYTDRFVHKALQRLSEKGTASANNDKPKYVFLEALAEHTQDPLELRSQALSLMLAGRDTTASLLAWCFRLMIDHPAVYQKLRAIILEEFGTYERPKNLSFAGLKACRYLQFCMNETLRLNPVVPINVRAAVRDTTLPRGGGPEGLTPIYVRKGQMIGYSVHVTHRLKEFWGEDADQFKPERWEGLKHGWEYLPFNGGPRICIGQQFALTEAGYVIVRLLQRFDRLEGVDHRKEDRYFLTLTSAPGDLVKVRLHEAV